MNNFSGLLFILFSGILMTGCTKGSGEDDKEPGETNDTPAVKHVLLMEFVSFDCVYCPAVTQSIEQASNIKYPGRIDLISVHGRLNENDPMEFKGYKQLQNYFYGVTGYPGIIVDQHDDLVTVGSFDASANSFTQRIGASAKVDIAVNTTLVSDNEVRIDVQLLNKAEANADYRLAVAVLENDIPYQQADLVDGAQQWIDNYRHDHVLRAFLSVNYFGDPIGNFEKNGKYAKTFTYSIPNEYKKEKLSFVVYVIEANGFSNRVAVNSRTVDIGKSIGFGN